MTRERYIHRELGKTVEAIGGSYTLTKEVKLHLDDLPGREVLYVVGQAIFDTTCCGFGGCGYANVQGFVLDWQVETDEQGNLVTEVEPITDRALKSRLKKLILSREPVTQVDFR